MSLPCLSLAEQEQLQVGASCSVCYKSPCLCDDTYALLRKAAGSSLLREAAEALFVTSRHACVTTPTRCCAKLQVALTYAACLFVEVVCQGLQCTHGQRLTVVDGSNLLTFGGAAVLLHA
jgi:hypothetical protein